MTTAFLVDQTRPDAHAPVVDEDLYFRNGQTLNDTHCCPVVAESITQGDQASSGAQSLNVTLGAFLADPILALAADVLDDLEKVRVANEDRLKKLTRTEVDRDGELRGFGLSAEHPDVARLAALVRALKKAEHDAELNLARLVRRHPLGQWIAKTRGVGEKQGARLLAAIGDPYWHMQGNRPRTVSELWAYAGYHTVQGHAPALTRGRVSNWSSTARKRTYLIAVQTVRCGGSYRGVYDEGRIKYAGEVHHEPCRRCGPSRKPAPVGSDLSDGHKHARALRLVSKAVLRDLWREAKRLHEERSGE